MSYTTINNNDNISILVNSTEIASMTVSDSWDNLFYNVTINGNKVSNSSITVGATSVVIDESAFTRGDLVDFSWINNDVNNLQQILVSQKH